MKPVSRAFGHTTFPRTAYQFVCFGASVFGWTLMAPFVNQVISMQSLLNAKPSFLIRKLNSGREKALSESIAYVRLGRCLAFLPLLRFTDWWNKKRQERGLKSEDGVGKGSEETTWRFSLPLSSLAIRALPDPHGLFLIACWLRLKNPSLRNILYASGGDQTSKRWFDSSGKRHVVNVSLAATPTLQFLKSSGLIFSCRNLIPT